MFFKILSGIFLFFAVFGFNSCKKDKFTSDPSAKLQFSQDSVLFDTVFTTKGSSTQNIRIRNTASQKLKVSEIRLAGGNASQFIINVDGQVGTTFTDIEIAAHDSMYIFIQVNVNPTNANSPMIISDDILFTTNGNSQQVHLEAWGQDAYYHYPNRSLNFSNGTYLPYSLVSEQTNTTITWPNDKPHVIYGYLVVDSTQKLIINAGTRIYMNYKAGLWVYRYGEIKILGQKGNEVIFQGARREKDYADEPGQWDRIWINEGSDNNVIDYAIIKNGYIGVQTEVFGNTIGGAGRLKITNSKIQNMSMWGLYSLAYHVYGANNVISNCQEYSLNVLLGGKYTFIHCTFANYWGDKPTDKSREKSTVYLNNHTQTQILPLDSCYFGNCIIDGKLSNEITLDLDYTSGDPLLKPNPIFSSCLVKTDMDLSDGNRFINLRKVGEEINYEHRGKYNFKPFIDENQVKGFQHPACSTDVLKAPIDILGIPRNTNSVTVGAYHIN